jgi:DNA repair protein SbcC/Rad50
MKILKLFIKNFNSFKGEHIIDFSAEPLDSANLYIISGATGAGKSSILDAITLALYGEVARLGSISKVTVESSGAIVTRGTTESIIELTYSVKGISYTSRWSIAKNKADNWRDYTMSLAKDNVYLSTLRSEIKELNTKIIGLNIKQFYSSILLSQGEFAKFIKSTDNERTELLEKLTGTSIFRKLGAKAFEKNKAALESYDQLKKASDAIQILSDETFISLKDESNQIELYKLDKSKQLTIFTNEIQNKNQILQKTILVENKEKELEALNAKERSLLPNQKKLEKHNQLIAFRDEIQQYFILSETLVQIDLDWNNLKDNLNKEHNALKLQFDKLRLIIDKEVNVSNYETEMRVIERSYDLDKQELQQTLKKGQETKSLIQQKLSQEPISELKTIIENSFSNPQNYDLSNNIDKIQIEIKGFPNLEVGTFQEFQSKSEILETEKSQLKDQMIDIDDELQSRTIVAKNLNKIIESNTFLAKLQVDIGKVNEEINKVTKELYVQNELKQKTINDSLLEGVKSKLKVGDECPICGKRIEHLEQHKLMELGVISIKIDQFEKAIASLKEQEKKLDTFRVEKDSEIKILQTQSDDRENQYKYKDLKTLDEVIAAASDVKSRYVQKEDQIKEIKKFYGLKSDLEKLKEFKGLFDERSQLLDTYTKLQKIFENKYKGKDIPTLTNQIQDEIKSSQTKVNLYSGQKSILEANKLKSTSNKQEVEQKLSAPLKAFGYLSVEECKKDFLADAEYRLILEEIDQVKSKKAFILNEISSIRQEILRINESLELDFDLQILESTKQNLQTEISDLDQRFGSIKNQIFENEQRIIQKSKLLKDLEDIDLKNRKWKLLKDLIGDSNGDKFNIFAQSLTLSELLRISNTRLSSLTDRYLLAIPTKEKPELEVIDMYMGQAQRSIRTLSGGEIFLLSLAMSLSLSDLASKNNVIESLFIDEGFGTLDQETLEMAMSTLENLQYQTNKKIGIISHVQSLKERIETKIEIKKNERGFSTINITGL